MKLFTFTKTLFQLFILTLSFAITSVHAQTALDKYREVSQQIYVGMLGRAAEPAALNQLANSLNNIGAPTHIVDLNRAYDTNYQVRALIESYGNSLEFQEVNAGDTDAFLNYLYITLFNRQPDINGHAYWKALIDNGSVTRGRAAVAIMASSYGSTDGNIVSNKVNIAIAITNELDLSSEVNAYYYAIRGKWARKMLPWIEGGVSVKSAVDAMVRRFQ
jgi:hypothetical protein